MGPLEFWDKQNKFETQAPIFESTRDTQINKCWLYVDITYFWHAVYVRTCGQLQLEELKQHLHLW